MNTRPIYAAVIIGGASVALGSISPSNANSAGLSPALGHSNQVPAPLACPDVPGNVAPISGLKTAWAIRQPTSPIRLLFSDQALACRDFDRGGGTLDRGTCIPSWQFALTLPPEIQKPGVYNLSDYNDLDFAENVVVATPAQGCNGSSGCTGHGTGSAGGAKGPDGTIEIYSATDECVTGRVLRLNMNLSDSEVDFTGSFQAVVCTSEYP